MTRSHILPICHMSPMCPIILLPMKETLHPSTQILERNISKLSGKILVINPPELSSIATIEAKIPTSKIKVSCQDFGLFSEAKQTGYESYFETHHVPKTLFDTVVVFLPKSDAEIEMVLAWSNECLDKSGQLILIGQNNAGIKSAKKTLEKLIGPITFTDNARHSAFYVSNKTVKLKKFKLDDYWQSYRINVGSIIPDSTSPRGKSGIQHLKTLDPGPRAGMTEEEGLRVYSLPGTFSHSKLDEGTSLLLASLQSKVDLSQTKTALDWGCGAGPLGLALTLIRRSIKVDMVDSSAEALASAEKTIKENALTNCEVFASNVFSGVKEKYDLIVANPPFHKGHSTSYIASETFIKTSKQYLTEHGHMVIVANVFLHYETLLEEQFGYVKTLVKTNKYKILEVINEPVREVRESRKEKKRRPKRTLEEAGFIDINDLDKVIVEDTDTFDD